MLMLLPGSGTAEAQTRSDSEETPLAVPGTPSEGAGLPGRRRQPTEQDIEERGLAAPRTGTSNTAGAAAKPPGQVERDRLFEEIMRRSAPAPQR
jgi:hypothetical protein